MSTPVNQLQISTDPAHRIDLYAAGLSMLCLVHCLALPLLTSFLPLLGYLAENEEVHKLLVLMAAPATLWAVCNSRPMAADRWPFVVTALSGLAMLLSAGFINALAPYELWLTVVGALCLASAHVWRWLRHSTSRIPNAERINLSELSLRSMSIDK